MHQNVALALLSVVFGVLTHPKELDYIIWKELDEGFMCMPSLHCLMMMK